MQQDLCVEQDVRDAFQATLDAFGSVDIVLANAGFPSGYYLGDLKVGRDQN